MAQATLHQILHQLSSLEPDELQQLNQAVQLQLAPEAASSQRETFHQALLASGLVRQIRQPRRQEDTQRRLVEVLGRPVSETIIAERR